MSLSETHARWFGLRRALRLLWCHGCGARIKRGQGGLLTAMGGRVIQYACVNCALRAYRRAAT